MSVLRIVDRIGSSLNLRGRNALLDEDVSDSVSTSLSEVAVVLFRTEVTGVTFNNELQGRVLLEDRDRSVDIVILIGNLRNVFVKVEEDLGLGKDFAQFANSFLVFRSKALIVIVKLITNRNNVDVLRILLDNDRLISFLLEFVKNLFLKLLTGFFNRVSTSLDVETEFQTDLELIPFRANLFIASVVAVEVILVHRKNVGTKRTIESRNVIQIIGEEIQLVLILREDVKEVELSESTNVEISNTRDTDNTTEISFDTERASEFRATVLTIVVTLIEVIGHRIVNVVVLTIRLFNTESADFTFAFILVDALHDREVTIEAQASVDTAATVKFPFELSLKGNFKSPDGLSFNEAVCIIPKVVIGHIIIESRVIVLRNHTLSGDSSFGTHVVSFNTKAEAPMLIEEISIVERNQLTLGVVLLEVDSSIDIVRKAGTEISLNPMRTERGGFNVFCIHSSVVIGIFGLYLLRKGSRGTHSENKTDY